MSALKRGRRKGNPWLSDLVGRASFTIGTEGSNAINVAIQLKDGNGKDIAERAKVNAYLANDANGDTILPHYKMPSGGFAIGTDGLLLSGPQPMEGLLAKGTLAISATAERFKTTSIAEFRVAGRTFTKAATDNLTFTAAHVITASKFGVVLIQINAAGTVSTKVPATPQAYDSAALALAALPAPDAGNVPLGYIAIANNTGDWTANTDDLTNGSDVTTAAFVDAPENGQYPQVFELVSESDGDIDITFTETRINSFRLVLVLGDGSLSVSNAISFV